MKKEYKYTINGNKYEVAIGEIADNEVVVTVNGEEYKVEMEPEPEPEKKVVVRKPTEVATAEPTENGSGRVNANNAVKAPLPGVITSINVAVGDEVKAGDTLLVLEAMKMANNIEAEKGGKVTAICVKPGQSVMEDDALVMIE